ncbi:MAG: VCBS repeat-containing protein [Deltaproteobacteria bacterium]|nr:VCBS repeat-containing protein [Deltaproteobacteria bacterium]
MPALSLHDFDADGDADLYAVAREEIFVFPLENGRFREKAGFRRVYRILTPAEAKAGNMNVAATVRDLDGDGHGDFVLSKFGGGLRDYQTEIRVFRGGAGGLPADPTYTLKTKGFSGSLEFPDADGDGKSDLVSPSVEITVLALIKFFTTKRVRIDYNLYRCGGASLYSLKPDYGTSVTFDLDDTGNFGVTGVPPFFGNDFDGDGKPDLLRGTDRDEIGVFLGTGGAAFADDPAWNASLTAPQQIVIDDLQRDGRADIILWYLRPEREGEIRVLIAR